MRWDMPLVTAPITVGENAWLAATSSSAGVNHR